LTLNLATDTAVMRRRDFRQKLQDMNDYVAKFDRLCFTLNNLRREKEVRIQALVQQEKRDATLAIGFPANAIPDASRERTPAEIRATTYRSITALIRSIFQSSAFRYSPPFTEETLLSLPPRHSHPVMDYVIQLWHQHGSTADHTGTVQHILMAEVYRFLHHEILKGATEELSPRKARLLAENTAGAIGSFLAPFIRADASEEELKVVDHLAQTCCREAVTFRSQLDETQTESQKFHFEAPFAREQQDTNSRFTDYCDRATAVFVAGGPGASPVDSVVFTVFGGLVRWSWAASAGADGLPTFRKEWEVPAEVVLHSTESWEAVCPSGGTP
jgi:hypothetical protein